MCEDKKSTSRLNKACWKRLFNLVYIYMYMYNCTSDWGATVQTYQLYLMRVDTFRISIVHPQRSVYHLLSYICLVFETHEIFMITNGITGCTKFQNSCISVYCTRVLDNRREKFARLLLCAENCYDEMVKWTSSKRINWMGNDHVELHTKHNPHCNLHQQ